jgi:hypothetical protein
MTYYIDEARSLVVAPRARDCCTLLLSILTTAGHAYGNNKTGTTNFININFECYLNHNPANKYYFLPGGCLLLLASWFILACLRIQTF